MGIVFSEVVLNILKVYVILINFHFYHLSLSLRLESFDWFDFNLWFYERIIEFQCWKALLNIKGPEPLIFEAVRYSLTWPQALFTQLGLSNLMVGKVSIHFLPQSPKRYATSSMFCSKKKREKKEKENVKSHVSKLCCQALIFSLPPCSCFDEF